MLKTTIDIKTIQIILKIVLGLAINL